jgi:4-hydroxybenzoate polyprenyltransferase
LTDLALAHVKPRKGVLRSYLELCRASNLPTVWTNVLCATLLAIVGMPTVGIAITSMLVAISISLSYLGGMALNDVLDVEEDQRKKPARPIPSGRITRRGAAIFAGSLFGLGLLLLIAFANPAAILGGIALIAVIYAYDSLHSKSWLTVILMASCRFLVFIVAALAVAGTCNPLVALAGAVQFVYIIALTVIARWEKAGDRAFKIPPIPWMLAAISLVDGLMLAVLVNPLWIFAGLAGAVLTRLLQTQVRGD